METLWRSLGYELLMGNMGQENGSRVERGHGKPTYNTDIILAGRLTQSGINH